MVQGQRHSIVDLTVLKHNKHENNFTIIYTKYNYLLLFY